MKLRNKVQGAHSLPKLPPFTKQRYLTEKEDKEDVENLNFSFESPENQITPKQEFYKFHKTIEKIQEQNKFYNRNENLMTCLSSPLVPPGSFGLFNRQKNDVLQLNHMKYGDKYMVILAKGLQQQNDIKEYHLNDNRMTQLSSSEVIRSTRGATKLSLSKNKIGIGCQEIGNTLVSRECKIQSLNLEDNKLSEILIIDIVERISDNRSLKIVNLSKNNISNNCCTALSQMLQNNEDLHELYLHFNRLSGIGAAQIFISLQKSNLKVLDLSQNSIGIGFDWSNNFNKMVQQNKELIHLDLSFNRIGYFITCNIAEGLKKNKSILGFHYTGNCGYVDTRGFLIPIEKGIIEQTQHQIAQRIQGCQYIQQKRLRSYRDNNIKDCCWICEGWRQIEFSWNPQTSGPANDPMFLHLSYQNYDDLYLGKVEEGLKIYRMVPPGLCYYFFTNDDMQCVAKDQPHKRWPLPLNNVKLYDKKIDVKLHQLNYINVASAQIIDKYYMPTIHVQPRTEDILFIPEKIENKIEWSFPISLFKDWKKDNEELLEKCFQNDWISSRITKLIKDENDREACYQLLKLYYQQFRDTYKHYASLSPVGDIWAISSLINLQLLSTIKMTEICEKGTIKQQDMELKYLATISGTEKGNFRKPERGMIRFQFLEMWVRIAEDKYIRNGIAKNYEEALNWLWEDHLKDEFNKYNTQIWRDQRYWNEQCDLCMKHYKTILDSVYMRYSVRKVKPGQKPFMCLQELQDMCSHIGLNQLETYGPNTSLFAFNKAMMTQIDEINQDRIFQMSFVEFLEAFARIAEEIDPRPIGLHLKIEQLIWKCYNLFADLFALPTLSYFQDEWDQLNKVNIVQQNEDDDEYY